MIVKGKAEFASVHQPNTRFSPQYCIDVIVDDESAKILEGQGLTVKRNATDKNGRVRGNVFKCKRNAYRKDGTANRKPNIVGPDGKTPFEELIGNGSTVNVQYNPYEWEFAGKKGTSADLVGVQIVEHVPYRGMESEFEAAEGNANPASDTPSEFDDDVPFS